MSLARPFAALARACEKAGLGHRITTLSPRATAYSGGSRKADPSAADVRRWLPPEYRELVDAVGYPAFDLGERHRMCFLPPPAILQVTGAMGDPARPFAETRALREKKKYEWPFAFFAGWELGDVNGWCFMPDDSPKNRGIVVWNVEDSLPESPEGPFDRWCEKHLAAAAKSIDSPAKVKKLLRAFADAEDDRKTIRLSDFV